MTYSRYTMRLTITHQVTCKPSSHVHGLDVRFQNIATLESLHALVALEDFAQDAHTLQEILFLVQFHLRMIFGDVTLEIRHGFDGFKASGTRDEVSHRRFLFGCGR